MNAPQVQASGQIPYVAFLRAVNVGKRKVEMARLRAELDGLGLGPARSYIASGNAFFTTKRRDRAALRKEIEQRLATAFGFEIQTALYTLAEVEEAYAAAPFGRQPEPHERFSLLFTTAELDPAVLPQAGARGDWEVVGVHGATAYLLFRVVEGKAPANPVPALEKAFGVQATGRFHHTVEKIIAAAKKS